MSKVPNVIVVGRFPPPSDGQSLLTQRLLELLSTQYSTEFVDTNTELRGLAKLKHFHDAGKRTATILNENPNRVVIWPSISPNLISHFRDRFTVVDKCGSVPIIAVIHWGDFDRLFRSPFTRWSASKMIPRIANFVFLDDQLASACAQWIPKGKIAVIPNLLDPATTCSHNEVDQRIRRGPQTPFRILYLSNMIRSKGYLDVLAAVKTLRSQGASVQADFVGAWHEDSEAFDNIVSDNNLNEIVTHHGLIQDRSRVKKFFLDSDVFVLPTYYPTEAQPSSIIEALSAGTPVVTCDQGGISGMVVENRDALFVPKQNPSEIATAIQKLHHPETWEMYSRNARVRFETHFNADSISTRWIELIEGAASASE